MKATRRISTSAAASLVAAGIVITLAPVASADAPNPAAWNVVDTRPTAATPWTVVDLSGRQPAAAAPRREPASRDTVRPRSTRRYVAGRRHTARTFHANTTCRPASGRQWLVGPGDTLSLVAACHPGVTVEAIQARNGLRGDMIRLGQVLHIPAAR